MKSRGLTACMGAMQNFYRVENLENCTKSQAERVPSSRFNRKSRKALFLWVIWCADCKHRRAFLLHKCAHTRTRFYNRTHATRPDAQVRTCAYTSAHFETVAAVFGVPIARKNIALQMKSAHIIAGALGMVCRFCASGLQGVPIASCRWNCVPIYPAKIPHKLPLDNHCRGWYDDGDRGHGDTAKGVL